MARKSNNETQTDLGDKTTQLKNGNATGDTPQPISEGELSMQVIAAEAEDPATAVGSDTVENGEITSLVPSSTGLTTEVSPGRDLAPIGAEMASGADLADEITVGGARAAGHEGHQHSVSSAGGHLPTAPRSRTPRHGRRYRRPRTASSRLSCSKGMILDGRCRYLGCKMAKGTPSSKIYIGDDPVAYVLSRNIRRRHLTEAQRAFVAARVANLEVGANQYSAGLPIGRASQLLAVSERSIARAKEVLRGGVPELVRAVESGAVSLFAGASISHTPQQQQLDALN